MAERHSLTLRTVYAELIDQLETAQLVEGFPPGAGSFVTRTVKGRRYVYFKRATAAGLRDQYVGPETPELIDQIDRHKKLKSNVRERRELVRALRAAGLAAPDRRMGAVLAALADAGVFRMRATLVGTIAYQTYPALLGVPLPATSLMTQDIDLAQTWGVSIAVNDQVHLPLLDVLRQADRSFRPISAVSHEGKPTAYQSDVGLRVEMLAGNRGAERDSPVRLEALQSYATPLRFLDFAIRNPVRAVLLHRDGVLVSVPDPCRYALHKLIVAARRGPSNPKHPKDLAQAEALLGILLEDQHDELRQIWSELRRRGRGWRELADRSLDRMPDQIRKSLAHR